MLLTSSQGIDSAVKLGRVNLSGFPEKGSSKSFSKFFFVVVGFFCFVFFLFFVCFVFCLHKSMY